MTRSKRNKMLIYTYLFCVHIIILVLFVKPSLTNNNLYASTSEAPNITKSKGSAYYKESSWNYYSNRSKTLDPNSNQLVFLGDSIINGLCVESVFSAINFGISGENVGQAKDKVELLYNLSNKKIILAYGINDIPRDTETIVKDYKILISKLPSTSTIYISSVLPINETIYFNRWGVKKTNKQIKTLNNQLRDLASSNTQVRFINSSKFLYSNNDELLEYAQIGDGIHLNEHGNELLIKGIKEELERLKETI